ncbi:hypothetical protein SDJN03_20359, partial [Cucurbita argyrosperma subsp. sororia]
MPDKTNAKLLITQVFARTMEYRTAPAAERKTKLVEEDKPNPSRKLKAKQRIEKIVAFAESVRSELQIWSLNHRGFCNKKEGKSERKSENGRKYGLGKVESENGEEFKGRREACSIKKKPQAMVYVWKEINGRSKGKGLKRKIDVLMMLPVPVPVFPISIARGFCIQKGES